MALCGEGRRPRRPRTSRRTGTARVLWWSGEHDRRGTLAPRFALPPLAPKGAPPAHSMSPERRRLTHALLLSLLIHALLLSLTFGGQGLWLPGFGFPWQARRIEVPDLRVVVVPAQVTAAEPAVTPVAEPLQQARVE